MTGRNLPVGAKWPYKDSLTGLTGPNSYASIYASRGT